MNIIALSRIPAYWSNSKPDTMAISIDGASVTWKQFEDKTNQLARAYQEMGVAQDDFVTIALPNGIEFLLACFAVWKLGATPQPVSPELPASEREAIVRLAEPALIVGGNETEFEVTVLPQGFEVSERFSSAPLDERMASNMKAMTSGGSTGRPKLIVTPSPAAWDLDLTLFGLPHESTVMVPGPLYHNGPFVWSLIALCQGNSLIITRRFDAENTLRLIEAHRVEYLYQVPTMMQRIWNLPDDIRKSYDLSSLRSLWHLAAPCPDWLKQAFIEWLGPEVIWELYGGTEAIGTTTISGEEWLAHRGSVGKPIDDNCEIRIVDDDGNSLPPGEVGEIFLRSKQGANSGYEYIGAEGRVLSGGWESLGDMGYVDEDGYLYLADRRTDLIISGGSNIYPAEVEAAIDAFPGVRSSAVIGLPHKDLGSAVHAIIDAPSTKIDEAALFEFLSERLVRYKHPRTLEFVSKPLRDEAGKVRRQSLREARLA